MKTKYRVKVLNNAGDVKYLVNHIVRSDKDYKTLVREYFDKYPKAFCICVESKFVKYCCSTCLNA